MSREEAASIKSLGKVTYDESKMTTVKAIIVDNHEYLYNLNSDINDKSKEYMSLINDEKKVFKANYEEEVKNSSLQELLALKVKENKVSENIIQVINIEENSYNITSVNMNEFNDEFNIVREKRSVPDLAVEEKVTLEATEDDTEGVNPSFTREEDEVNTESATLADDHLRRHSEEKFEGNVLQLLFIKFKSILYILFF